MDGPIRQGDKMTSEMTEALKAGIEAMGKLQGMIDRMVPLVAELTEILEEGQRQLVAHDLIERFR